MTGETVETGETLSCDPIRQLWYETVVTNVKAVTVETAMTVETFVTDETVEKDVTR